MSIDPKPRGKIEVATMRRIGDQTLTGKVDPQPWGKIDPLWAEKIDTPIMFDNGGDPEPW